MGLIINQATGQCVTQTPPIAYSAPYCLACWYMPTVASQTGGIFQAGTSGAFSCGVYSNSGNPAISNGLTATNIGSTAWVLNTWYFLLFRGLSGGSLGAAVSSDGSFQQSTNSFNTATATTVIGTTQYSNTAPSTTVDGHVAEVWLTNKDIQIDGSTSGTDERMVRQLAACGPFSIPHVAASLVEYYSFKFGPKSPYVEQGSEAYSIFPSPSAWVPSATAPTMGLHPPLSSLYVKPRQTSRILTV